jgi:predicted transposase YbfD/YdcC
MDRSEYTTLVEALGEVPDPRNRRGQRYPWRLLLVLIAAAVVSGQRHARAISQWVREYAPELADVLADAGGRVPSEATLRRALRAGDVAVLEAQLAGLAVAPLTGRRLVGVVVDGKEVRGAGKHGAPVALLSLVRHDGRVLAQTRVATTASELTHVPALLAGVDLHGRVVTLDALLTQREVARQIVDQGGHYLMAVKDNQPEVLEAITLLFAELPWLAHEWAQEYWQHRTIDKEHGRLATRVLEASTTLNAYLDWPGLGQVLRRTCRRVQQKTGEVSEHTRYAVTSLPPDLASAATLERLWRGHWTIENQVHYPRDVTFGEDAGQARVGQTPHALAALRNAALNLFRAHGWTQMPDALRHYGARVERALTLIGVRPAGL